MNNYAKMRRSNVKVRAWLIKAGYSNLHFFPHSRFSKDLNIDSIGFDGIASKDTHLVLFQVKSNCKISKKLAMDYKRLATKYNCECIWFNVRDREKIEIYASTAVYARLTGIQEEG